jgi:type VI secretion system protein ImpI
VLGAGGTRSGDEAQRTRFSAYRSAWQEFSRELFSSLAVVPANSRREALARMCTQFPGIENEPDFARLSSAAGAPAPTRAGQVSSPRPGGQLETVAIEGLRELAQGFCPSAGPLETADQVVRFLERIRAFIEVFLKCYLPMRDGHRQFETDMALRRPSAPHLAPQLGVETAKNPKELAETLLDWRVDSHDNVAAIESAFADMMVHQVALINGVMHGVKSLLQELSPIQTEQVAHNSGGLGLGPYRYKTLWKFYEQRYSDVADEEKQIFAVLFGKQFAQAYGRFFETPEGRATGGASQVIPAVSNPEPWERGYEPPGRK